MNIDFKPRQEKIRQISGVDAVAIVPGTNMVYFTGLHFHLSERPIVAIFLPDGALHIITPELEVPKLDARPDLNAGVFMWNDVEGFEGAFAQAIADLNLTGKTLGVDGMTMRVFESQTFERADASLTISDVSLELIRIRSRKMPDEVAAMQEAVRISEMVLGRMLEWVEPGMTEKQISRRLAEELISNGTDGLSFEPLVQTGPNSALPHGMPGDRALQENDFLLIDFGGTVNGYPADITRTFCLGTPTDEMQKIYDTVLRANEAAKAVAGPGVPMGAVDKAARDVITEAGYGEYFIHRTGHGLGLDVHEPIPQIAAGVTDTLEPGMAFTIEPGIYVPGLGGVRIEDNVVVTEDGIHVLTSFPRMLQAE
ncbi:MAG: aminopeptidase P family protein [Chloroflexi bacterium]|nr:MAG: aminopeptidase P family protein [Chloroflexota bacterium]